MTAPGAETSRRAAQSSCSIETPPATVIHVHVHSQKLDEAEDRGLPSLYLCVAVMACAMIIAWLFVGTMIGGILSGRNSVAPYEVAGECGFAVLDVGTPNCTAAECCVETLYNLTWRSRLSVVGIRCLAPPDLLRNVTKCFRRGSRLSLAHIPETEERLRKIRAAVWCTALIPPFIVLLACTPLVIWLASRPRGREPWLNCQ